MKKTLTGIFLAAALLCGMTAPAAMADGEEAPLTEATAPPEPDPTETEPEQTPEPDPEPTAQPPEDSPEPETPLPAETPAASPSGGEPAETSVPEEEIEIIFQTVEADPMAAKAAMAETKATAIYSQFTTRALNQETLRKGIDVSVYQKKVDWNAVAASGVEFVFIRGAFRGSTNGGLSTDTMFKSHIQGAKAAGLKVGVYIFSQAITTDEAVEEADYLINLVKDYGVDLPLVLDVEFVSYGRLEKANLSKREATDICNAFCDRVEQSGYDSMVYANPTMLNNHLYASELGRLWLAHYTAKTGYAGAKYEFWQCADNGKVDGVSGAVDLDFWFEPGGLPFTDVSSGSWYYGVVSDAYNKSVVNGMTATTFSPGGTATRGQVVTMLHRMADKPGWTRQAGFTDLTQSYYKDAVYWAAETGAVKGFSDTEFGPEEPITREQLVTILYRLSGSPEAAEDLSGYTDAAGVQSWAAEAMAWAVEKGVVTGYEDDTLRPQGNATRAEVCALLMRYAALS